MCTVSWLITDAGYQLFFNRDEQRSRSKALPPQPFQNSDVTTLMPIDPDGGGSWISVNDQGLTLCLLNFYQGRLPDGLLHSRGQLLKNLSALKTQSEITTQLNTMDLYQYAPFTLLAFSPDNRSLGFQWDGETLQTLSILSPMTSSSVEFDRVYSARQNSFSDLGDAPDADQLLAYHLSHQPIHSAHSSTPSSNQHQCVKNGQLIQGEQSVCMHRDDAKSVSFSHIEVTSEQVSFNYLDGSPCAQPLTGIDALRKVAHRTALIRPPYNMHHSICNQERPRVNI